MTPKSPKTWRLRTFTYTSGWFNRSGKMSTILSSSACTNSPIVRLAASGSYSVWGLLHAVYTFGNPVRVVGYSWSSIVSNVGAQLFQKDAMSIVVPMNLSVYDFAKKMIIGLVRKLCSESQVGQGSRRRERGFFLNRNFKQRAFLVVFDPEGS